MSAAASTERPREASPRWEALGLTARHADRESVADLLLSALVSPDDDPSDPVVGIVSGVRDELLGISELMAPDHAAGFLLRMLAQRLGVACRLLERADAEP